MNIRSVVWLLAKLAASALFVYGFIAFADLGAGELAHGGGAYIVSPYIWGSHGGWPLQGLWAFEGLLMALTGFFVLRFKPKESDLPSEIPYVWPFVRAFFDTLILFFAVCLTWEVLLSICEPDTMYMQIIQFLAGTGISNTFVMNLSAIMLILLMAFKLRSFLFGWLPPWLSPKGFPLGFGFLSLCLGVVIIVVAFSLANSSNVVSVLAQPRYFSCNEECYFAGTADLVGGIVGVFLALLGLIVSMERLFSRERALW
jgi:drug/metabolite transporter superfamily protein YnfA